MAIEALVGLGIAIVLLVILLVIAWFALLIWALVDLLRSRNDPTWKILWVLVIALMPFLGVILYYLIGRRQRKKGR